MTNDEIATVVNCDVAKIKTYTLDNRIPRHIRNQVIELKAKMVVLGICRSRKIPESIKGLLYERAILDIGDPYRLNGRKFEHMKDFFVANNLPNGLLNDLDFMQRLIDDLLYNNFRISDHMRRMFHTFPIIRIV